MCNENVFYQLVILFSDFNFQVFVLKQNIYYVDFIKVSVCFWFFF